MALMTFERVAKILSEHKDLDISQIREESQLSDLGLDSLDTVELIMEFEDEFNVALEMSDKLKTVGDIVSLIDEGMTKAD